MSKAIRILILADIDSIHTQKWVLGLAGNNTQIGIFSFNHPTSNWFKSNPNIICLRSSPKKQKNTLLSKLEYILLLPRLMQVIRSFKPDVLHAHYASSYGLLGALSLFHPFVVSVWGSDILKFPKKSLMHKMTLKFVFIRAKKICATSTLLKREVALFSRKPCEVIPFGINLQNFYSFKEAQQSNVYTIGCIKHLEPIYNIDKVIAAFQLLLLKYPGQKMCLKIIGEGSEEKNLRELTAKLQITGQVEFIGKVQHEQIPEYLHQLNVLVNVSEYESFGVSVAEAMACKIPVIVSAHEGFKDLVPNQEHALIVPETSVNAVFEALEAYYLHEEWRESKVNKSYHLIHDKFDWFNNLRQMKNVYNDLLLNID